MEIDVKSIFPNPDQPRREFDADRLSELAASIKENGLLQPISVIPKGKKFMIVAGERRFRAMQMLGWKKVPAQVINDPNKDLEVLSLIENIQREQLTSLEKADYIKKLYERYQSSYKVGSKLGISDSSVREYLVIANETSLHFRDLLRQGLLSVSYYKYIKRLKSDVDQSLMVDKALAHGFKDSDEVQKLVTFINGNELDQMLRDSVLSLQQVTLGHAKAIKDLSTEQLRPLLKRIIKEHLTVDEVKDIVIAIQNPLVKANKEDEETVSDFILNMFKQLSNTIDVLDERAIPYITDIDKQYLQTNLSELILKITEFENRLRNAPIIRRVK